MEPTPAPIAPQNPPVEPSIPPSTPTPPVTPNPAPLPGISQTVPRSDGPLPPPPFTPSTPISPPAAPMSSPAATPLPTVMVGDGGMSPPSSPPGAVVPPAQPVISSGRKIPKKLLIAVIAIVLLLVAVAAWYFGYYMNASVIYSQSLKNTGKGYDKLVTYVDKQDTAYSKGYVGSGSYTVKFSDFSTDGKINLKSGSGNGELSFDVGLGVTRVNADIRTIKSSGNTPDVYVKASDIKGLGTVIGVPDLDTSLAKLDNTWIVIDHTLVDSLDSVATAQAQANASAMQAPTHAQLLDEARAFGKVNQQYLFSTAKDKAVTKVVKKYGVETVDGHKAYHYKIALQPANVKKYIYAQRDALKASSLNDWLKKNNYDKDAYDSFNDAADSTKDIKTTDTYDIWMDVSHRIVYKVRFSEKQDPATNYVDVGLDYKGGDTFPFFVAGNFKEDSESSSFRFATTINTKLNSTAFNLDVKATGSDTGNVSANFTFKPSTTAITVAKPSGAIPLSQVLSELGLGDVLSQYTQVNNGINTKAEDTKRQTDIAALQTQLEAFFSENGYYPSLSDMNSTAWLNANMKSLDQGALTDPSGTSPKLAAVPAAGVYAYQVTDSSGKSCEADPSQCAKYTLTATFAGTENGQSTYSKSNLD